MQFQTTTSRKNNQERRSHFKYCLLFISCWLLAFSSCDDSFDPLQKNDKYHFSIYGTLDAAADTQWVRIGIPRENINETPDPAGMSVILENIDTGQSVVMQDSLFTSGNLLNYWTTMPLENEQTYRIKVSQEDGKASMVTVTIPEELPTPIVISNGPPNPGLSIIIDGSVEHIADVQTKWYVLLYPETQRIKKIYTFTYRNEIIPIPTYGGAWYVFTTNAEQLGYIENNTTAEFIVLYRQFYVAAGGPEWIDEISAIDNEEYFLDGTASNVENGLGYVVGIDSKWIPFRSCVTADSSNVAPCEPEEPFWK